MFVDWILPRRVMNVGQNIRLTRHDTTTDMSDGRCFLETHCILCEREWQQTTQVIASSPSDISRDGQSVSDSRTVGKYRRSVACHSSFHDTNGGRVDTGAISREHVAAVRVRDKYSKVASLQ